MGCSRSRKINRSHIPTRNNKNFKKATIESLPHDLLTEILARTAASSFIGLYNVKLSSKIFQEAANDSYVFQKISVENCPLVSWRSSSTKFASEHASFWERCKESKNVEALYIQGVVDYFGLSRQEESGLKLLIQASKLGHIGARYILGIILLLNEDGEKKKEGMKIIEDVMKSTIKLSECRNKLNFIARRKWLSNPLGWQRPKYCQKTEKHGPVSGWESDDETCIECRCGREVKSFCNLFPNI